MDRRLNAFITMTDERALAQAQELETELTDGNWRGPLDGIPIALKDNIDTAGVRSTAASAVFADRIPDKDAEVVTRLKEAGAIILGKLNSAQVCLWWEFVNHTFRPSPQSLGLRADPRRIVRRLGNGRCGKIVCWRGRRERYAYRPPWPGPLRTGGRGSPRRAAVDAMRAKVR